MQQQAQQQQQQQFHPVQSTPNFGSYPGEPEKEKFEVIPMNADKPSGLEMDDFLPNKMKMMGMGTSSSSSSSSDYSRFSAYSKNFDSDLSEADVTASMLKGHESMMRVLAARGRNVEIIHKLWQNKDAKTGKHESKSFLQQTDPLLMFLFY